MDAITAELLTAAAEALNLSPVQVLSLVLEPKWNESDGAMWDWRNHTGEVVQRLWPALSLEACLAVILTADAEAEGEDWDGLLDSPV